MLWKMGSLEVQLMGTLPPVLLSIALDPLYPSRCSWQTFGYATSTNMAQASDGLSPLQLSGQLNSLPCSLAFRQEETISIIRLIEQVGAWAGGGSGVAGPAWGGGYHDTGSIWVASRQSSPRQLGLQEQWGIWLLAEVWQLQGLSEATSVLRSLGPACHLRHSQVLPLPAAVPVVPCGHPGEPGSTDIVPSRPLLCSRASQGLRPVGRLGGCSAA